MSANPTADEVRRAYGVPDSVRLRADAREVLAWVDGAEEVVRRVAAEPDALPRWHDGPVGRAPLSRLRSAAGPVVVRESRKGGALRRVRGRRFLGRYRPLDELVVTRRLAGAGAAVLEAVGAVVLKGALGWRGFLLTREVPHAVDLEAWLYGARPEQEGLGTREVLHLAGATVRRLHDEGVEHADLHPKNLLVEPDRGRVLAVDLDRARALDGPLPPDRRLANLTRLARAIEKHRRRGMRVGRREALRFLEGYAGDADDARRWLEAVRERLRPSLALHVAWWRLTGQDRPSRAAAHAVPRGDAAA